LGKDLKGGRRPRPNDPANTVALRGISHLFAYGNAKTGHTALVFAPVDYQFLGYLGLSLMVGSSEIHIFLYTFDFHHTTHKKITQNKGGHIY